ncbi:uncharacterized protein LOC118163098 [Oxyura jamaicensis]|uniref:uncharacterized protein LOC118163098 n=1 Tax=Oxyura jamaicensis TaxID=8884 RepID=UPI0015A722CB|nr:uncharacterized protein LOC118163098 [Oxyura jamaicensis]
MQSLLAFSLNMSSRTKEYARNQCSVPPLLPPLKMAFSERSPPACQDHAVPFPLPGPKTCGCLGKSDPGGARSRDRGVCERGAGLGCAWMLPAGNFPFLPLAASRARYSGESPRDSGSPRPPRGSRPLCSPRHGVHGYHLHPRHPSQAPALPQKPSANRGSRREKPRRGKPRMWLGPMTLLPPNFPPAGAIRTSKSSTFSQSQTPRRGSKEGSGGIF